MFRMHKHLKTKTQNFHHNVFHNVFKCLCMQNMWAKKHRIFTLFSNAYALAKKHRIFQCVCMRNMWHRALCFDCLMGSTWKQAALLFTTPMSDMCIHALIHAHMQTCTFLTLMFAPGLGAPCPSKAALRDRQTDCWQHLRAWATPHVWMCLCMYARTWVRPYMRNEVPRVRLIPMCVCVCVFVYTFIHVWGIFRT